MAHVTVVPETFEYVDFDNAAIVAVAERLCEEVGLPGDLDVVVDVDESTPAARAWLESSDPFVLHVDGGAFEHTRKLRTMSNRRCADALGRLLLRVTDRMDKKFGDPPDDPELTLAEWTAWEIYCVGRLSRLGYDGQKPRRLYQFRNRHGFSDHADHYFGLLWDGEDLTWSQIVELSNEASLGRAS